MSARTSTVGPLPFRSTPTTPVPPTFSITFMPGTAFSATAILPAVRTSLNESSGLR